MESHRRGSRSSEEILGILVSNFNISVEPTFLRSLESEDLEMFQVIDKNDKTIESSSLEAEATGLIFDERTLEPICVTPPEFMSPDNKKAPSVDWETAEFERYIEGDLVTVFFFEGQWFVQDRGAAEIRNKFLGILLEAYPADPMYPFNSPDGYMKNYSISFIISGKSLYLIGAYNKRTNAWVKKKYLDRLAGLYGWRRPPQIKVSGIKSVRSAKEVTAMLLDRSEKGMVIRDECWSWFLVENPNYGRKKYLRVKKIAEIVLEGKGNELASRHEATLGLVNLFENVLVDAYSEVVDLWHENFRADSRRMFAASVSWHPFSKMLFKMFNSDCPGEISLRGNIKPARLIKETKVKHPEKYKQAVEQFKQVEKMEE